MSEERICPVCLLPSDADPRDRLDLHDLAHGHPDAEQELAAFESIEQQRDALRAQVERHRECRAVTDREIVRLRAENARLREVLLRYGKHDPGCNPENSGWLSCECGWAHVKAMEEGR